MFFHRITALVVAYHKQREPIFYILDMAPQKPKGVVILADKAQVGANKLKLLMQLPMKWRLTIVFVMIMAVFCALKVSSNSVYAVSVDGKVVAHVESKGKAEKLINQLIDEQTAKYRQPVELMQDIVISKERAKLHKLSSIDELRAILENVLAYELQGAAVKVDGKVLFAFESKKVAQDFLDELKKHYQVKENAKVSFEEDVSIEEMPVRTDEIIPVKKALDKVIESGTNNYYIVKEGDTIWDIALANDLTEKELLAYNPGFEPELMQIGQKIKLTDKEPLINVVSIFEQTEEEKIAAPVEIRRNSSMLQGKSKVIQEGADGLKEVKYKVVAKNGVETEKVVLAEKIKKEAVAKIVEKGTRTLVASRNYGGGRLAKPAGGYISSAFGPRWGRMHEGVDIVAAYGSPVVAAEAGTVIRAGWYSGYGKCIDVSHGNGLVTRYAHLSKISVSAGQRVQRGQIIGAIGNTGRSTGPHLHFEVLINGRPQNPINYW